MHGNFDLNQLAAYLHLAPERVLRMAERGQLPGRKIAGAWQFSRSEIHHWLEERIGASGEQELVEVEVALDRHAPHDGPPRLAEWLPPEGVDPALPARTRNSAITAMCELAVRTGRLWDSDAMAEAVRARESLHSTALDNGVALLHPRRPLPNLLDQPLLALGRTPQGIPFGGSRGRLTDLFFLICAIDDAGHLRLLTRLSRLLTPELLERLRMAEDSVGMRDALLEEEARLEDES